MNHDQIWLGKKVVLGITASIAAYKSILLLRMLVKAGAEVQVVLTPSAVEFVSPLVLETLSKKKVIFQLANNSSWENHVMLGRWADLMIIAPCTCNTLAKMTAGISDNLLLAVYLSAICPVLIAPAMDEDMWQHVSTQRNIDRLKQDGLRVLPVAEGFLASGLQGKGRMIEPEDIFESATEVFTRVPKLGVGLTAIVTAGPTYEAIDPVRFIGNHSSGKMGIEIANALTNAGVETTLVLGPSALRPQPAVRLLRVTSAQQMFEAVAERFPACHLAVMAAAVADFRPATIASQKIKKESATDPTITLIKNPDILHWCGHNKTLNQYVVGFALETQNESTNALDKLKRKRADLMVLNSLNEEGAGFGVNTNKISTFDQSGEIINWPLQEKADLACGLTDFILKKYYENKTLP